MSISLAVFWHQHQPYYKDQGTGEMVMPWVRLHGIKDYYGMARLIQMFPGMRCTINLVPSMVAQVLDYVEHGATDPYLRRTEMPADALSAEDAQFVLDGFFMAHWDRMVRPYSRYGELLERRRFGRRPAARAAEDFSVQDLRDLQIWFNLTWFHPLCFEEYEALRVLREKGRDFSEADKQAMLAVQKDVLAKVVPLHRELAEKGQVELTTTPFYHPILPLLLDMEAALEAMPRTPLPAGHFRNVEDAEAHVAKAVRFHEKFLGEAPVGMWPAEGSVSPALVPLVARHGIKWIATDEEILSASLGQGLRGGFGRMERPDLLYRPWRVELGGAELDLVFRDHQLSDLVGFQYQSWDGDAAAQDFVARIQKAGEGRPCGDETLVSVILDGENCWEHYPEQGVKFLKALYGRLQDDRLGVAPVRVRDFVGRQRPTKKLGKLFSGSWINHDFYIWIGHRDDRKGWEYVYRVRDDLVRETEARGVPVESDVALAKAWEQLYIAEGSDWFWWYGDDHTSGMDDLFDRLFRDHLKAVYRLLGRKPPLFLDSPIGQEQVTKRFTPPSALLHIVMDGKLTHYFEWLGAGSYRADKEHGAMHAAAAPLVMQILFGYDKDHLFIRADFHESHPGEPAPAREVQRKPGVEKVRILFAEPNGPELAIGYGPPLQSSEEGAWPVGHDGVLVVWGEILECRIPFATLGLERGKELAFFLEASGVDGRVERFPRGSPLVLQVPPANVEEMEWIV
ncbi:MAG: glycoside hydrolase family 57 protein [Planctomycetota bacterium]|nr:glycoside hydrolase family 57 protein [Planctomycetota bacterium]